MSERGADRLAVARDAAQAGAERALADFRGQLEVETKADPTDVVTETDRAAQRCAVDVIESSFPDEPIVGEEADAEKDVPETGTAWIVDPIDGTSNYVRGLRLWTTAVAAIEDGEPIAAAIVAPALDDVYLAGEDGATRNGEPTDVSTADRPEVATVCPTLTWPEESDVEGTIGANVADQFGQMRRLGSAQLELALVADGGLGAAVADVRGAPWDTVAGVHLVRASGGRVTDAAGERWRHDADSLVASNGRLHDVARAVLAFDDAVFDGTAFATDEQ